MRPPAPLLALALCLLSLSAPARGAPYTNHFDALLGEVNDRFGALPETGLTAAQKAERRALRGFYAAISADSPSVLGDLRMAKKMLVSLGRGYPGDATMEGLEDGLLASLSNEVEAARDTLEIVIANLPDGKAKDRAGAGLASVDGVLTEAAAETDRVALAKTLARAQKGVTKTLKIADSGGGEGPPPGSSTMTATIDAAPWEANDDFGTLVSGTLGVSASTGGIRRVTFTGRMYLPGADDPRLPGEVRAVTLSVVSTGGDDIVPGTYPIGGGPGLSVSASYRIEEEDGTVHTSVATSGSITLGAFNLPSNGASGSFDAALYDGVAMANHAISGGQFSVEGLLRTSEP